MVFETIRGKKGVPQQDLLLTCYVQGHMDPFFVSVTGDTMVGDLKKRIKQEGQLDSSLVNEVGYWKVEVPCPQVPQEIEWSQYQRDDGRLTNPLETVSSLWSQPPSMNFIHIYVAVPSRGSHSDKRLPVQTTHPPHEDAITFTAPTRGELRLTRSDSAHAINDFSRSGLSFDTYFLRQSSQNENVAGLATVTDSEIGHHISLFLCRGHLSGDRFLVEKNGQFDAIFLHILAEAFKSERIKAELTSWPFPLLITNRQGERQVCRYTPMSDFRLEIKKFPLCILEVVSDPVNQVDRWRMLVQATCLARLGNRLRKDDTDVPVVIMAIYIDAHLLAHEYLVYQPDRSHQKVVYHERMLDLTDPPKAFKFLFRLYNFPFQSTIEKDKLVDSLEGDLVEINKGIPRDQYPGWTSKADSKRPAPSGGGAGTSTKRPRQTDDRLGSRSVQDSLEAAGYELIPTDDTGDLIPITQLKPTMREATSSDGLHVVLKVVDDDTDELLILKELNKIKSAANHTIELHGIVHTSFANVIALRWRTPFDKYIRFYPSKWVATFPEQFLEGVAFLHHHRVAHLDLKPENLVVDGDDREHPPRILIIDFGLSIFVEDENTVIEGFRGTVPWVAPEVGTYGGPRMEYSAILADRWACGRMICHIEGFLPGGGNESRGGVQEKETITDQLMSDDPRSRPSLKKALDVYQRGGVKRIAEEVEGGEGTQKRARVSAVDPIRGAS